MRVARTLATMVLAVVAVTAGCTAGGTVQHYAATPVGVATNALDAAGYQRVATRSVQRSRTVYDRTGTWEGGGSRNVTVVERMRLYAGPDDATLVTLSSPGRRAYGNETTVRNAPLPWLLDRTRGAFPDRLDPLADSSLVATRTVGTLGSETTVRTFAATTAGGRDVRVHLLRTRHERDVVVAVARVPPGVRVDGLLGNLTAEP